MTLDAFQLLCAWSIGLVTVPFVMLTLGFSKWGFSAWRWRLSWNGRASHSPFIRFAVEPAPQLAASQPQDNEGGA